MDFQDVKMPAGSKERFEELFFSSSRIPTGSVKDYYEEVSGGKISLAGEVLGPFTLSQNKAYYANGNYGRGWPEPNSMTMANEAVTVATGKTNFDKFDNDGNGYVRFQLLVFYKDGVNFLAYTRSTSFVSYTLAPELKSLEAPTTSGVLNGISPKSGNWTVSQKLCDLTKIETILTQ